MTNFNSEKKNTGSSRHCRAKSLSDASTPKGSARDAQASAKAKRPMDGDDDTSDDKAKAKQEIIPKPHESAGKQNTPPHQGGDSDEGLEPHKRGLIGQLADSPYVTFWTLVATVFLAAATLALAVATADMAASTRTLAELAKQQAHDTQIALRVASRQATAAEVANNLTRSPALAIVGQNISPLAENTELTGFFLTINTGHSPARNVAGSATVLISEIDPKSSQAAASLPITPGGGAMLFPVSGNANDQNLKFESKIEKGKITKTLIDDVKNSKKFVYLFSRVDYLDQDLSPHFVTNCAFLRPDGNIIAPCAGGNAFQ